MARGSRFAEPKEVTVRLTPAAEADVEATLEWYGERGPELGEQFRQAFERSLELIQENPRSGPKVHGEIRRALLRRFPYCIFYIVEGDEVIVLGCLHGHRDPRRWKTRRDA